MPLDITRITRETPVGGDYAFLERYRQHTGEEWTIRSIPLNEDYQEEMLHPQQCFGYIRATGYTQFFSTDRSYDIHRMKEFAAKELGISIDPSRKGCYTLGKRLSRTIGSHYKAYAFLEAINLNVDETLDTKTWDGWGLVSRRFAERMADEMPASYREWYRRELASTQRWEFTIVNGEGQYKGHCLVVDDLEEDFRIPDDCKREMWMNDGSTFVALRPVHAKDHMRMDVQSIINLYDFIGHDRFGEWLRETSRWVMKGIQEGDMEAVMQRMDITEDSAWHVPDYFQRGGEARWFAGITRALGSQYITQLERMLHKPSMPVPGARYYVAVAETAGRQVGEGEIELDPITATAWVSEHDWQDYLAERLGGADQDDALWCIPFTDERDEKKRVLIWRSPNQAGEYALLTPTADCHTVVWDTTTGESVSYPRMDGSKLPPVIEEMGNHYLGLVDEDKCLQASSAYGFQADIVPAIVQAMLNQPVLGIYCNRLMVTQAIGQTQGATLPCKLETVIDAQVKTGADTTPVRIHCEAWAEDLAKRQVPIPRSLLRRVAGLTKKKLAVTSDHFMDRLLMRILDEINAFRKHLNAYAAQCVPPSSIIAAGMPHIEAGSELRQVYGRSFIGIGQARSDDERQFIFERARLNCEAHLAQFTQVEQQQIVLGALAGCYLSGDDDHTRDSVVWQMGAAYQAEDGSSHRRSGIVDITMAMLCQQGLIAERVETEAGKVLYWSEGAERELAEPITYTLKLNNVWFNLAKARGATEAARPGDALSIRNVWVQQTEALCRKMVHSKYALTIQEQGDRYVAVGSKGNVIGFVPKRSSITPGSYHYTQAVAKDGNIIGIVEAIPA